MRLFVNAWQRKYGLPIGNIHVPGYNARHMSLWTPLFVLWEAKCCLHPLVKISGEIVNLKYLLLNKLGSECQDVEYQKLQVPLTRSITSTPREASATKMLRIFRHARVSCTSPCQSVCPLVRPSVRWSHFRISTLSASLVALREKLKREDPNYFCVFS